MNRSELSEAAGINKETLRYYEKIGLIPEPARDSNNYRLYSLKDLERLQFILEAKKYGFKLKDLQLYLDARESSSKGELRTMAGHMLDKKSRETREQIKVLKNQALFLEKLKDHLMNCPILGE